MRRALLAGPLAGLALALSLPPFGWWPLGIAGVGLLAWGVDGTRLRARLVAGFTAGVVSFAVSLVWIAEFTQPGFVLLVLFQAAFWAAAGGLARHPAAAPLTFALAEALRATWPWGGHPLGGPVLGQAAGPLSPAAGVVGSIGLLTITGLLGAAAVMMLQPVRRRAGAGLAGACVAVVALGLVAPDGANVDQVRVAAVQGGGERGFVNIEGDDLDVLLAHVRASDRVRGGDVDVVLWPEDVVDVDGTLPGSDEERAVAAVAREIGAPVIAGVVEDAGPSRFRNSAVVWDEHGRVRDRYEKVRRVPFGEFIPLRGLVGRLADISAVPRDAVPGSGPGIVRAAGATFGVTISYEVFYADRARAAVRAGGRVLLVPTNAASFRGSQVPTQEVAAARLRAIETGRWVVQAAPTGYSAIVRPDGRVVARSTLGRPAVLQRAVPTRSGHTPYTRIGDWPILVLIGLGVAAATARRARGASSHA